MTSPAVAEFKLSITRALASQLEEQLGRLTPTALTEEALAELQKRPGIYELSMNGDRVYVGKASKSLPDRLRKHLRKLQGRTIDLDAVGFICVYVDEDLDAASPERMLINRYRQEGTAPWNTNGFGNNDPGVNRDEQRLAANHFDAEYPIDPAQTFNVQAGRTTVGKLLRLAKKNFRFTLRFQGGTSGHPDYKVEVSFRESVDLTLSELAEIVIQHLPDDWQFTAFPGYAILYKKQLAHPSGDAWWRRATSGEAVRTDGPSLRGAVEEEEDPGEVDDESDA